MFSIGEFSKITGLTVKTLRFYHEQGVLTPSSVDDQTGYRYYGESKIEAARVVCKLRELDFSLADIAEMLKQFEDDADILDFLESQKRTIQARMQADRHISRSLDQIITKEREARVAMQQTEFQVEEKAVDDLLIAGVRMQGKYSECGKGFGRIGRKFGMQLNGKPLMLCYDSEYKEDDADFEPCMPIKKGNSTDEISVRTLAGGRCASLLHKGPYEELSRSYEVILRYMKEKGYKITRPTREVYIKGPGMIFRGNPKKYLTEIQVFWEDGAE